MFAAMDRFVRKAGDRLLKEKYWEEMLRGLRDDPNKECEEYEEKQWKEEQDRRLIPILFYQYANDKTEEDIKQTRKKVKEDLGTVAGDFLLPVLSKKNLQAWFLFQTSG